MFPIKNTVENLSKLNLQNFRFKPEELAGNSEILLAGQSSSAVCVGRH